MTDQPDPGQNPSPGGTPPGQQARPPLSGPPAAPPPPPPGYAMPAYAPPKHGGILHRLAVSLIATVLIASVGMNIYFAIILAAQFDTGLKEAPYAEGSKDHRVVIVDVSGTIDSGMAEYMRLTFIHLDENPPDAIVLRIDSGGGGVTASDQIWHYFTQFKDKHDKVPVVASFGTVAASGGYYIASPADHIVCETTGITGSIGVMAQAPTMQGLMEDKLGVKWETMVATGSPDKDTANNLYRDWTDEDRAVFQNILDSAMDRFIEVVALGRSGVLSEDEVRKLATGKIFNAEQALNAKLVDQVGYLDEAIDKAASLAKVPAGTDPTVTIIRRPQPFSILALMGASHQTGEINADPEAVRSWINDFSRARLEYRHPW